MFIVSSNPSIINDRIRDSCVKQWKRKINWLEPNIRFFLWLLKGNIPSLKIFFKTKGETKMKFEYWTQWFIINQHNCLCLCLCLALHYYHPGLLKTPMSFRFFFGSIRSPSHHPTKNRIDLGSQQPTPEKNGTEIADEETEWKKKIRTFWNNLGLPYRHRFSFFIFFLH